MPVTQKDIAQRLELSINTVSRALRNMPDVNESTRKQVQAMAEEMGYYKNLPPAVCVPGSPTFWAWS